MKCEYFEGCPVFKRGGEAACKRHFCNDTCPKPKGKNNADHSPGRMEQSGDAAASGKQPAHKKGRGKSET